VDNYQAKPLRPVLIKIRFSGCSSVYLAAILCRLLFPAEVLSLSGWGFVYLALLAAMIPVVTVIGWNGAKLTFPWRAKVHSTKAYLRKMSFFLLKNRERQDMYDFKYESIPGRFGKNIEFGLKAHVFQRIFSRGVVSRTSL